MSLIICVPVASSVSQSQDHEVMALSGDDVENLALDLVVQRNRLQSQIHIGESFQRERKRWRI